ncbi:MAG: hypothetical protein M3T56_03285 [Chloroflexota bacterium]|nr:hypothetical protein [Chloroflexota bacterium]
MTNSRRGFGVVLALAVVSLACGSAVPTGVSTGAPTSSSEPTLSSPAGNPCPTANPRPGPTTAAPLRTPVGAFAGKNGGSVVFAIVESVDAGAQLFVVTFPNSSTGGLAAGAPPTVRATLRVTSASVLQQVAARKTRLVAGLTPASMALPLGPGAPAVPAKAPVVLIGVDECGLEIQHTATVNQAAAAGSTEWALAAPLGRAFPAGANVVVAEVKALQLSDLQSGDTLIGTSGQLLFGLVFVGSAPDFVLTRLLRACKDDPCPRLAL